MSSPLKSKLLNAIKTAGSDGLAKVFSGIRLDALVNEVAGFGTTRDRTTYNQYVADARLSDQYISNLYHGSDTAARCVEAVPEYELQKGLTVDVGDETLNRRINAKMRGLGLLAVFKQARTWGRLFGGSAVLLGCDDGRASNLPLIPERARNLDWLFPIDKRYLWPMTYYQEMGPKFGQVETFMFSPMSAQGQAYSTLIHESRLVTFPGDPTARLERDLGLGWDQSVLQRIHAVLTSHDTAWKALEIMLTESQQAVFSMSGLADGIASGNEAVIKTRMQIVDLYRSVMRAMVIDADAEEKFERQYATFTGVADAIDRVVQRLAAAMKMPVTILMGQSPAGMNATGESDLSIWYNRIEASQTQEVAPRVQRVVEVFCATKEGPDLKASEISDESIVKIIFPSLWTESPSEKATRRNLLIQGDVSGINAGIWLPEESALTRSGDNWDGEIKLSDMARKAREQSVSDEFTKILMPPEGSDDAAVNIELAPADIGKAITLNEARASQGLPPSVGPDGDKPLAEIGAPAAGGFSGTPGNFDGSEDQPRDEAGRFADTGGGGGSSASRPDKATHIAKQSARVAQAHAAKAKAADSHAIAKKTAEDMNSEHSLARSEANTAVDEFAEFSKNKANDLLAQSKSEKDPAKKAELKKTATAMLKDLKTIDKFKDNLAKSDEAYDRALAAEPESKEESKALRDLEKFSDKAADEHSKIGSAYADTVEANVDPVPFDDFVNLPLADRRQYGNDPMLYAQGKARESDPQLSRLMKIEDRFPVRREDDLNAARALKSAEKNVARAEKNVKVHEKLLARRERSDGVDAEDAELEAELEDL